MIEESYEQYMGIVSRNPERSSSSVLQAEIISRLDDIEKRFSMMSDTSDLEEERIHQQSVYFAK